MTLLHEPSGLKLQAHHLWSLCHYNMVHGHDYRLKEAKTICTPATHMFSLPMVSGGHCCWTPASVVHLGSMRQASGDPAPLEHQLSHDDVLTREACLHCDQSHASMDAPQAISQPLLHLTNPLQPSKKDSMSASCVSPAAPHSPDGAHTLQLQFACKLLTMVMH